MQAKVSTFYFFSLFLSFYLPLICLLSHFLAYMCVCLWLIADFVVLIEPLQNNFLRMRAHAHAQVCVYTKIANEMALRYAVLALTPFTISIFRIFFIHINNKKKTNKVRKRKWINKIIATFKFTNDMEFHACNFLKK